MSKNLKLTGLQSYTGVATQRGAGKDAVVVKKGEVCRFNDDIALRIEEGGRVNSDNEFVGYWAEVGDDAKVNHNFSDEDVEVDAPVVSNSKAPVQRRTATAAAKKAAR